MNVERGIFEEPDPVAKAADARARADVAAERVVPHEDVVAWRRPWGTPEKGPPPATWSA